MRTQIAFLAAVGFGCFGLVAPACSSNDAAAPAVDAAADVAYVPPLDGGAIDADTCGSGLDDAVCFNASATLTPDPTTLAPVAHQNKCASDDLVAQFLAACLPVPSAGLFDAGVESDDSGVDAGPSCDAFVAANPDCAQCLGGLSISDGGTPAPSPWSALLPIDDVGHVLPAVAVCVAAISTATDTCKSNYASDNLCAQSSCSGCAATDLSACEKTQLADPISTCLCTYPIDTTCTAAISAVSTSDANTQCGAGTTINTDSDFDDVFTTVGRTLCE